jgi:pimeloyl-ACP methyl ester carboxylesterase
MIPVPALDGVEHRYADLGDGVTIHVITADLTDGYAKRISDFEVELVDDFGHWIAEQRPELVLDRIRGFLRVET